jgi:hypothetical protein
MQTSRASNKNQQGMVLIMLVFLVGLAATAFLLNTLSKANLQMEHDRITAEALAQAKAAIIGWSVTNNVPGQLPCPEDTSLIGLPAEGQALSSCNTAASRIGRLPWRTLKLANLRDAEGEPLWYVLSDNFRVAPVNTASVPQLSVNTLGNQAVAIIFSPGKSLAGQNRGVVDATHPPDVQQYLDGSNQDGDTAFVTQGAAGSFNDKLTHIRPQELFGPVALRVLGEIKGDDAQGMKKFYLANHVYPFADSNGDGDADAGQPAGTPSFNGGVVSLFFPSATKNMLINHGWTGLVSYSVDATQQSGTITLNGKSLVVTP